MTAALGADRIAAAFIAACHAELQALKPGNVHVFAAGHGMEVAQFEAAAAAAAPFIAETGAGVGQRIRNAVRASFDAVGCNTNLGIVLLCAPLAKAAAETTFDMGLRRRLALILSALTVADADDAFAAIAYASPAGLGTTDQGDVHAAADITLIQAMALAQDRDRIALNYATAFADIFDFGLDILRTAKTNGLAEPLAITSLHMAFLAEFPDSHIARKYGQAAALKVQAHARELQPLNMRKLAANALQPLANFDAELKSAKLNPGTTADLVVATLFTERLISRK